MFRFAAFELAPEARRLLRDGAEVPLRPKAFDFLLHLVRNAGRTVSKDELLEAVWPRVIVTEDSITQCAAEVRRALGDEAGALLRTVPRHGYRLDGPVVAAAPADAAASRPAADADPPSLVVLPFANLSSDPEQTFFADGLTEDLIGALGRIRELLVLSRSASFAARDRGLSASQAARELGVRHALEGSVRTAAGRIRVTARLLDAGEDREIWSDRFDGEPGDVFAMQDEITRSIAVALQVRLTTGEFARLWEGQTRDLRAWERMVAARDLFLRFSEADTRQAQALLEEALAIDPRYTGAMVLLGMCHWWAARAYPSVDREEAMAAAEGLADRALALDPALGSAVMLRGGTAFLRDRHEEALRLCRHGCELAPGDFWNHAFLAVMCIYADDLPQAFGAMKAAFRLSPRPPAWCVYNLGLAHLWAGDTEVGIALAERYLRLEPTDPYGYTLVATAHGFGGNREAARAAIAQLRERDPTFGLAHMRRSQRYRDPAKLDRVVRILTEAGLPA